MNCDEAFDAMTDRELFRSDALQQHLKVCTRCRQMSEVLSPALALFDSSERSSPGELEETTDSTSYESLREKILTLDAVILARETAQRLASPTANSRATNTPVTTSRLNMRWLLLQVAVAAATSAAVAIAIAMFLPSSSAGPVPRPSSMATTQVCMLKNKPVLDKMRGNSNAVVGSCVACHFEKPPSQF